MTSYGVSSDNGSGGYGGTWNLGIEEATRRAQSSLQRSENLTATSSVRASPDIRRSHYGSSRFQQYGTGSDFSSSMPPQNEIYDSMHRMSSSEPIYLDLNPNMQGEVQTRRQRTRSSPEVRILPGKSRNRINNYGAHGESQYKSSIAREYGARLNQTRQQRLINQRKNQNTRQHEALIMFGDDYDLGSLSTGMSQQELLKKRRDVKKRRDKKYGKRKKKQDRIINMPPLLLSKGSWENAATTPTEKFRRYWSGSEVKKNKVYNETSYADNNQASSPRWNMLQHVYSSTDEDMASTADTTHESTNQMHYDAQHRSGNQRHIDDRSFGSDSFPLLSTNAAHAFASSSELITQNHPAIQQFPPHPRDTALHQNTRPSQRLQEQSGCNQLIQEQSTTSQRTGRRIRFAEEIEQRATYIIDDDRVDQSLPVILDHMPWDEPISNVNSNESPTSIMEFGNTVCRIYGNEAPEPKSLFEAGVNDSSPKSNSVKPKSILRKKETMDDLGRVPQYSQTFSPSRNFNVATNYYEPKDISREEFPTPIFTDANGRELSPIRSSVGEQQDHTLPETYGGYRDYDDDSGLISDAFIEAVAAVVLQTCIRRFLAIRAVEKRRKKLNLPMRVEKTKKASLYPAEEVGLTSEVAGLLSAAETENVEPPVFPQTEENFHDMEKLLYSMAATQIQSIFRGWWVRDSLNVDHYCATLIQKIFRGSLSRGEYHYDLFCIILVQSMWRQKLAIDTCAMHYQCIIMIQSAYRSYRARQMVHRILLEKYDDGVSRIEHTAATTIQKNWRAFAGEDKFIRTLADIMLVQSVARRWLAIRILKSLRNRSQISPTRKDRRTRIRDLKRARRMPLKIQKQQERKGNNRDPPTLLKSRTSLDTSSETAINEVNMAGNQDFIEREESVASTVDNSSISEKKGSTNIMPKRQPKPQLLAIRRALKKEEEANRKRVSATEEVAVFKTSLKSEADAFRKRLNKPDYETRSDYAATSDVSGDNGTFSDPGVTTQLLRAWREKDKKNTFTIKPRGAELKEQHQFSNH